MMKTTAYLSLGSNLGDKWGNLSIALHLLEEIGPIRIIKTSSVYLTEPWGKLDQDDFLNQVVAIKTDLTAWELLETVKAIEQKMGRVAGEHWGPRLIDIDIILFGGEVVNTERLTIPHPYFHQRAFVLVPLLEIEPEAVLPGGEKLKKIYDNLVKNRETGCVRKVTCDKMSQRKNENG